ncbi:kinase-like protein [Coniophora puteana RWD-64-598 SS2]|uniref:Kinase-like protein n=1 Tax=Coniophora puteana (strain RWD-64-598) TaxID=741705 RepID=A0A5M3MH34_CONPW|nr:kinase-like protein [Coniophora puteana RWD-64-598 SS2]EIW78316.1 kinase-like protein [Coniophora puteana RWD-64-598 SS2]
MYRGELRSLDLISGSIDSVYRYIVANPDVEDRQLGVEYLADIIALSSPLSLSDICNLFTTDVRKHIAHLSAIVSLPPMDSPSSVQIYHSSLRDYLSTRSRSGDFYVDPAESHRRLAGLCLKLMRRQLNPEIREQKAISGALRYACLYWPYHIEAMSHSAENQALVFQFIQEQLPFFLEAFSLMGCFDLAVVRLTEASRVVSSWKLSHEQNTFPAVFDVVTKYLQLIPVYPIYPAVALSHASFCLTDPSALSTLKDTLDEVIDRHKYDGPLSWLLCHAHIRAEFHKVIDTTLRIQPDNARCRHMFFETCPPADCDVASLAFQLSSIFKSYDNVIDFFSQEDQNAQTLVDVLQAVRIRSTIDARSQRMFRYGLIQLAANSGRYAQCLQLRNINIKWEMRPIGHGGLSAVYKGNIETQPDVQLALKVIRMSDESYSKRNLQKFASEVTVWSQLRHPNILSFSGVFQGEGRRELYTISPYLSYGNICNYLEINPSANRTLLALDVAQALNFLHGWSPEIVHANINGSNILVSDTGRACLVDFESTTAKDRPLDAVTMSAKACLVGEDDDMTSELSSIAWMAPEIFDEGTFGRMVFTTKSDMYAFGGVCYELFCGKTPFRGLRDAVIIFRILRGRTPDRIDGPHVDDSVWAFMQQCWRKEPTERPTAKEAVEFFKARVLDSGMSIEPAEEWDYSIMDENLKQAERFLYLDPHPTPCGSSSGQEVLT